MSRKLIEIVENVEKRGEVNEVPGRIDIFKFTCVPVLRPVLEIVPKQEIGEKEIMPGAFYTAVMVSSASVAAIYRDEAGLLGKLCLIDAGFCGVLVVKSWKEVVKMIKKIRFLGKDILSNN